MSDILTDQSLRVCKRFVSGPIIVRLPDRHFLLCLETKPVFLVVFKFSFPTETASFVFHFPPRSNALMVAVLKSQGAEA